MFSLKESEALVRLATRRVAPGWQMMSVTRPDPSISGWILIRLRDRRSKVREFNFVISDSMSGSSVVKGIARMLDEAAP